MTVTPAQGFVYGLLQGLTEVLPISSSAHLVLLPWFAGWKDPGLGFDVALHGGTLLAVLWYFWRDWLSLAYGVGASLRAGALASNPEARLFWQLALASVPAALAGVVFGEAAETTFRAPLLLAATLSGFGVLLYAADRLPQTRRGLPEIGWADAILIGIAQALAIVPGVSRSGVTITMARFLRIDREASARFSFLLATPIVFGAKLLEARSVRGMLGEPGQLLAFAASTVFGFVAIAALLRFVRGNTYSPFVVYRFALAALIVTIASE
ncbi:MAG: undecaprenyl-diphosphate phosphatase [Candidatus Binatia bacterium]